MSRSLAWLKSSLIICFSLWLIVGLGSAPVTAEPAPQTDGEPVPPESRAETAWRALPPEAKAKVDPRILAEFEGRILPAHVASTKEPAADPGARQGRRATTRFLVYVTAQPDLEAVHRGRYASKTEQRQAVFDALVQTAQTSQAPILDLLSQQQQRSAAVTFQPLYIVNAIAVEGDLATVTALAQRDDVARLAANYPLVPLWQMPEDLLPAESAPAQRADGYPWNITQINAHRVWQDLDVTGQGAVVGGFDTGVNFNHPALVDAYRGNAGGSQFRHDYNWFQPSPRLYTSGDLGPSVTAEPFDCDYASHGTHTMGTMVGDGGTPETAVGVAPAARWIAVPGICWGTMAGGISDDIGGLKAFQWFLCPTDLSGSLSTADCSKAPDVVNNSWGSSNPVDDTFRPAIQALRTAGIVPVFAAGNIDAPGAIASPAHLPETVAVGATDNYDDLAYFSARGPFFGQQELKPNLTAPGAYVPSTVGSGAYASYSGTSMAAPHVAGVVALMVSADLRDGVRDLAPDEMEALLRATAVDLGEPGPDSSFGAGRLDAYDAVAWTLAAGDLRGTVRDADNGAPIAGATLSATHAESSDRVTIHADAAGNYSFTVASGSHDLSVQAWGYETETFSNQRVVAGSLSTADFVLRPQAAGEVTGIVRSNGQGVADARVSVAGHASVQTTTAPDGSFQLTLPQGTHTLLVESPRHRTARQELAVTPAGATVEFTLASAPSILLVEADTAQGWFEGWPIGSFFEWALQTHDYPFELWRIRATDFFDQRTLSDGSVLRGIPSADTLSRYEIVIWAHSGCNASWFYSTCNVQGTPASIGADGELATYLARGGRLILSGQDLGWMAGDGAFLEQYLRARPQASSAAAEDSYLQGSEFLEGLALPLTNASFYGYANSGVPFSPDSVVPNATGGSFPILTYRDETAAALAVAPCDADYRAVYMAMGFENVAPRGGQVDRRSADLMARSLDWLQDTDALLGYQLLGSKVEGVGKPGKTIFFNVQLANTGAQPLTLSLTTAGNRWPVQVLAAHDPVGQTLDLPSCSSTQLRVAVQVPQDVSWGATDVLTLTVTAPQHADLPARSLQLTSAAFPTWESTATMSSSRFWMGGAALPDRGRFYTIGGLHNDGGAPLEGVNEYYDACTDSWTSAAPLPENRALAAVAALHGELYVAGGFDVRNPDWPLTGTLFIYDPGADAWRRGPDLPAPLAGASMVAVGDRLYLFGGIGDTGDYRWTLVFDPATQQWTERAPMPVSNNALMAGAALGDRVHLVGGLSSPHMHLIYDPAADTWQFGAAPSVGRFSAALVAAPDGHLYLMGGGTSLYENNRTVERYSPQSDGWESVALLQDGFRFGLVAGFVAGKLVAAGGLDSQIDAERLSLRSTFCDSSLRIPWGGVRPGDVYRVEIELFADAVAQPGGSVAAPLPDNVRFDGFIGDAHGAVYNAGANQVEWTGALPADAARRTIVYSLRTQPIVTQPGDRIENVARFDDGQGHVWEDRAWVSVFASDLSGSTKTASAPSVRQGDRLTYTVDLRSRTPVGENAAVVDVLPEGVTLLPDTLTASSGTLSFDPASRSIEWSGALSDHPARFLNTETDYVTGDSDGNGVVPDVSFEWIDIGQTGTFATSGDDRVLCGLPIGFPFPFYDGVYEEFCVDTNGLLTFGSAIPWSLWPTCPLPDANLAVPVIAGLWSDLVAGEIRYQQMGVAPDRRLIVQWSNTYRFGIDSQSTIEFQIVLHEGGSVRVHYRQLPLWQERVATVGVQSGDGRGATYTCQAATRLHDELSVALIPPGGSLNNPSTQIEYAVHVDPGLGVNSRITNTARIRTAQETYERSTSTLVNRLALSGSNMHVSQPEISLLQQGAYTIQIRNDGAIAARNASLVDVLPRQVTYLPDSLSCSTGSCAVHDGAIVTWTGAIEADATATVAFSVTLSSLSADRTPVTNTATLYDGFGGSYSFSAIFIGRKANLSDTFAELEPRIVHPGDVVTYTIYLYNSGGNPSDVAMTYPPHPTLLVEPESVHCGAGTCGFEEGAIWWRGTLSPRGLVPVRVRLQVPAETARGTRLDSAAQIEDQTWDASYTVPIPLRIAQNFYIATVNGEQRPVPRIYIPFLSGWRY